MNAAGAVARPERPNILLLMADQLRRDALGYTGRPGAHTPAIDALARSSVSFTNAVTPAPICVAARMSMITGLRAAATGWPSNDPLPGPPAGHPTMMSILAAAGWHTEAIGKMHFGGRSLGLHRHQSQEECVHHAADDDYLSSLLGAGVRTRYPHGIRDLLAYQPQTSGIATEHAPPAWIARRACRFLEERQRRRREQPFFLWCSWIQPHLPFAPPEPWDALHDPERQSLPMAAGRPLDSLPSGFWRQRGRMHGAHLDAPRIRRLRALYACLVSQVDAAVGQVLQCLDRLGLAESTVVIFTSDHGEMLGDHGLSRKGCPYEAAVRVPLLLRWPGRSEAGRVCPDLASLTDLLPTLLTELGLPYLGRRELEGASLLGTAGGGLAHPRNAVFVEFGHGRRRWVSIRTHRYAYARHAEGSREELYDLQADLAGADECSSAQPRATEDLRRRVLAWEQRNGLPESFAGPWNDPRAAPEVPAETALQTFVLNEGRWPENLPPERRDSVESYAEAFTRAIAKESTISPEQFDLSLYKRQGGRPLTGTPWEDAWRKA